MTAPTRSRADAVRNAEKVLAAAREVFAERGLGAGIDEVASRAGVGKATVYRCWATKEDLVAAVAGARVEWFTAQVLLATEETDPWAGFEQLMVSAVESCAQNALLYAGLTSIPQSPELEALRATCRAAMQHLVERCQAAGRIDPRVTGREVMTLLSGAVNSLTADREQDIAVWRRYAELVVAATRT
ncbi:MAG: TetR/AcrR family transcriptional regulator [Frankiales bacterium]|nr:TetR/AcrR family transcriptional regulator [Frankiales bacterium]